MDISLIDILSALGLILSIVGNICVNLRKKSGFIIWSVANLLWIAVNFLGTPNFSQIVMYLIYTGFNIHGLIMWHRLDKDTITKNTQEV